MKILFFLILLFGLNPIYGQEIKPKCIEGNCKNKIGTFQYADGSVYIGSFSDRKRFGQGTMKYKDGSTYSGFWVEDLQLDGVYTDKNGTVYIGHWNNGSQNGKFFIDYYNGSRYEGLVLNNLLHGLGKLIYNDGSVFEGIWEYGKKKEGKQTNKDRSVYSGQWLNDNYHGTGKFTSEQNNIYTGTFVNGKYEGQGTMQYNDGSKFSGEWKYGSEAGNGTYTYKDGKKFNVGPGIFAVSGDIDTYFGQEKNGKQEGFGIFKWTSGAKYIGGWINGEMHGYGMYIWADGEKYEGNFEYGEFSGNGVVSKVNGEIKQSGLFIKGKFAENGVTIGPQNWMFYNLRVTTFRNGDPIFKAESNEQWQKAKKEGIPAYCCPLGNFTGIDYLDECNQREYGYLYNYFAVMDPRGLAPKGWHIPNIDEVESLLYTVGNNATNKLKSKEDWGIIYHGDENGSDDYGFSAVPSGLRGVSGNKNDYNRSDAYYWTSESNSSGPMAYFITSNPGENVQFINGEYNEGMAVRCVKDGSGLVSKPSNLSSISKNSDGSISEKKVIQVCSNQKYNLTYFELNKFFFESTKITIKGDIVDDLFNGEGLMQASFNLSASPSEVNKSGEGVIEKVYIGNYLFSHQQNKSQSIEGRVKIYLSENTNEIVAVVFGVKGKCSYQVLFK